MSSPLLHALRLSEDEWAACRQSAREMTLASGKRVSPAQVAVDYVQARDVEYDELLRALGSS